MRYGRLYRCGQRSELADEGHDRFTNQVIDFENFILPRIRRNVGHDDVDVEAARALSGVRAEYLNAAIDEMERLAGSVDRYLEPAMGVDSSSRETLQNHYLEQAGLRGSSH